MDPNIIKDYMIVSLKSYTSEFNRVIKLLQKEFNTNDLTEDSFRKWQNKTLIEKLVDLEDDNYITANFITNLFSYNLYEYDDIDFIKSLNLEECKKLLNKLDYENYTITINKEK